MRRGTRWSLEQAECERFHQRVVGLTERVPVLRIPGSSDPDCECRFRRRGQSERHQREPQAEPKQSASHKTIHITLPPQGLFPVDSSRR